MIDPERLRSLNALLEQALALPPAERDGWLAAISAPDQTFVPELRRLLQRAAAETDSFMRQPAGAALDALAGAEAPADQPGDLVGPYRLMAPLGEGGMATVWCALRSDGSLEREVALKLPHVGATEGLARRMARERDLLAALEHPHIARLYDAGVTEDGRPWLAMERVSGLAIDEHVRRHRLDPAAVLHLALQVCAALAHAHGRLIVHRDLKPSNILVTHDGEVRLLDFGIGKLLQGEQPGTAPTAITQFHGRAMTPDYASPEQVAGRPVTVATDVYSLGVVLYELLTGQRPYRLGRQSTAALEEAILAADVPLASSRCADRTRARALRGDLDAVLAKALAKEPGRRYASVESLAADLRAHLEGLPVAAQAPSRLYRTAKFLRRHRALVASTTAVILSLGVALTVALVHEHRAEQQVRRTLDQMARTEILADLATYVLFDSIGRGESVTLQQLLERTARFADQRQAPLQRAVALHTLATWYGQRADVATAERILGDALRGLPPDVDRAFGPHLVCLKANLASAAGRHDEASELLRQALARSGDDLDARSYCLHMQSTVADRRPGGAAEAERSAREALALLDAAASPAPLLQRRRALLGGNLAWSLSERGDWLEADRLFRQAWTQLSQAQATDSQHGAITQANWAGMLLRAGRTADALPRYEGAAEVLKRRSADGADHPVLTFQLAKVHSDLGHEARALPLYERVIARASATGALNVELAARLSRGLSLLALGDAARARQELERASALAPQGSADLRGSVGVVRRLLEARLADAAGQSDEAALLLRQALQAMPEGRDSSLLRLPLVLALADVETRAGRPSAARDVLTPALAEERGRQPAGWASARVGRLQLSLGLAQKALSDPHAAATLAAAARELAAALGADSPYTLQARALTDGRT